MLRRGGTETPAQIGRDGTLTITLGGRLAHSYTGLSVSPSLWFLSPRSRTADAARNRGAGQWLERVLRRKLVF